MSTAIDLTRVLVALENATVVNEVLSQKRIEMMKDTVDKNLIGRNLDEETTLANKIGTAGEMIGDMGLLYFPNRPPIALTIMVEDSEDSEDPEYPGQAEEEIAQLAQIIVNAIGEQ